MPNNTQQDTTATEEKHQFVVFELSNEEYAVAITDLESIIKTTKTTPIPNAPEFIKGIINLRGQIVVVIDLKKKFSLEENKEIVSKHIIIARVGETSFGVIVDAVTEVLLAGASSIQPTPDLISGKIHADYLKGVIVIGGEKEKTEEVEQSKNSRLITLLNLPKILQAQELLELKQKAQEINPKNIEATA
jgi:purine-binding chemotaxis protein CheW